MYQKKPTISTQYYRSNHNIVSLIKLDRVFQIIAWCCIYLMSTVHSSRILGIFPIEAKSHFSFHKAVMKPLLSAGHQVTLIAPFQLENIHENLTIINSQVIQNAEIEPLSSFADINLSWFTTALIFTHLMEHHCNQVFSIYDAKVRWYTLLKVRTNSFQKNLNESIIMLASEKF